MGTDNLFFSTSTGALIPTREKSCRGFMAANQHHPAELNHIQIFMESQNSRLEGTSRIIRSNLSWQKHCPDKMIQQNPLSGKILHFPGKIIPGADFSPCGNFPSDIQSEPPQEWFFFFPLFVIFSIWLLIKEKSPCPLQPLWKHWNLGMRLSKPSSQLFLLWQLPSPLIVLLQPVHISLEQQGPDLDTPGTLQLWPAKCWAGWNSEFSISAGSFLAQGARNCDPPRSFN